MVFILYFLILFLLIINIIIVYIKNNTCFHIKEKYTDIKKDFIISINVHEKPDFLIKQLANIKYYIKGEYNVILNCNEYMYNELKDKNILDDNVIINPEVINKERMTGTLFHGIYSNLKYILDHNIHFSYFIVLSSRNLFYCEMNIEDIEKVPKIYYPKEKPDYNIWHWPIMLKTKLAQYYIKNNSYLTNCAHEGLVFNYEASKKVYEFLENNSDIRDDLFNFSICIEEFALQTIIVNQDNNSYYLDIGHGCDTNDVNSLKCGENKFVYKTIRE